jgi:hypothetical protein
MKCVRRIYLLEMQSEKKEDLDVMFSDLSENLNSLVSSFDSTVSYFKEFFSLILELFM